jgi:hypothetical protein
MGKCITIFLGVILAACSMDVDSLNRQQTKPISATLVSAAPGWTAQDSVAGEYLVTVNEGVQPELISGLYAHFGVKAIRKLGDNLYQINIENDPGQEKMNEVTSQSKAIKSVQPNYIYRIK